MYRTISLNGETEWHRQSVVEVMLQCLDILTIKTVAAFRNVGDTAYAMSHAAAEAFDWLQSVALTVIRWRVLACSSNIYNGRALDDSRLYIFWHTKMMIVCYWQWGEQCRHQQYATSALSQDMAGKFLPSAVKSRYKLSLAETGFCQSFSKTNLIWQPWVDCKQLLHKITLPTYFQLELYNSNIK